MNSFTNPYGHLSEEETHRLQSRISNEVRTFFWSIRASKGTFVNITNILISKLHAELSRRGIVDLTHQSDFESFVSDCKLVLPTEIDIERYGKSASVKSLFPITPKPGTALGKSLHGSATGGVDQETSTPNVSRRNKGTSDKVQSTKTK
jgi:hypothetical protein